MDKEEQEEQQELVQKELSGAMCFQVMQRAKIYLEKNNILDDENNLESGVFKKHFTVKVNHPLTRLEITLNIVAKGGVV